LVSRPQRPRRYTLLEGINLRLMKVDGFYDMFRKIDKCDDVFLGWNVSPMNGCVTDLKYRLKALSLDSRNITELLKLG